jgi:O-antigen/teichoic acid export membrane protein
MILNISGAEEAAYYFIAMSLINIIFIIPESFTTSFFIEACYGKNLKNELIKSLVWIFFFLLFTALVIYYFGDLILSLFGKDYIDSLGLLRILIFSSFFEAIYLLIISIQNIRMNLGTIVLTNLIKCILLSSLSFILLSEFGIVGIGYAMIITYIILASISVTCLFISKIDK